MDKDMIHVNYLSEFMYKGNQYNTQKTEETVRSRFPPHTLKATSTTFPYW